MATSSITKTFVVKNPETFKKQERELNKQPERKEVVKSPSLEKGRAKLATFVFR